MDEQKDEGLKEKDGESEEKESDSQNDQPVEDDIKDGKEDEVDKLLDGTSKNKTIVVKKERFDDRNEKAKIYEATAELLDKVLEKPDVVAKLLGVKDGQDQESRLQEVERTLKAQKRAEMRSAISDAMDRFEHLKANPKATWEAMEPMVSSLYKGGYSYAESVSRAYIALHPEEASKEVERMAQLEGNKLGVQSGGGFSPKVKKGEEKYVLSEDELKVAKKLGHKPEDYAKLLVKHKSWIEKNARKFDY